MNEKTKIKTFTEEKSWMNRFRLLEFTNTDCLLGCDLALVVHGVAVGVQGAWVRTLVSIDWADRPNPKVFISTS